MAIKTYKNSSNGMAYKEWFESIADSGMVCGSYHEIGTTAGVEIFADTEEEAIDYLMSIRGTISDIATIDSADWDWRKTKVLYDDCEYGIDNGTI